MAKYADKLRDPRWQKRRLEVQLSDLSTLCEDCHEADHAQHTIEIKWRDGRLAVVSVRRARELAALIISACDEAERECRH